ncbi:hypothetical protein JR316_0004081 [Psilocybe cubensis]|uniref:Uncharacterized protein n=1 Tax=Psilocybe cubensis TaxID=181762 RepID=A0ACB8H9V0_PSICU|nr:hypothetical protein JR316_0004081 [Psilocybe cubensis]KAH9484599.1 hypothetical protein JR316_0004081 [Psilocybe cubensis]
MEKLSSDYQHPVPRKRGSKGPRRLLGFVIVACITQGIYVLSQGLFGTSVSHSTPSPEVQAHRASLVAKCKDIHTPAGPPSTFSTAERVKSGSDRWVPGTPPTLLKNAKIWTGARNGTEVVFGDVLLDKGVIVAVGYIPPNLLETTKIQNVGEDIRVLDVGGKWITPGLVDLHSHIGVYSSPELSGASDGNSLKAPILPWLRSIDGLNTHDESYQLAMAGGVTTAQILPGSANNIGGQAFVIKLRPTEERSATSKVLEPPLSLTHSPNGTDYIRWRHMKHACGENPNRLYGQTRMDGQWNFRHAYDEARKIRDAQDAFCAKVEARDWASLSEQEDFPEDLQWESLVDVLRGRVKLSIHCYEAVDLDGIVRLSNEFKFPVASFHHAGETYLVPDLLKKTWGGAPSIALFASNFRKKREAYRGSEFAPRVLAGHGIPVVMKSDHPVVNSRYLLFEAQQAHYYGLNPALALASVTSVPAQAAGLGHRVGTIAEGMLDLFMSPHFAGVNNVFPQDIVVWDSHPLSLGATPEQVYVDGIPQISDPQPLYKPAAFQDLPVVPNWDIEANEAVKWEGLPPLRASQLTGKVVISGINSLVGFNDGGMEDGEQIETVFEDEEGSGRTIVVDGGKIVCIQHSADDCTAEINDDAAKYIDLEGGTIAPGLTTYGSPLGLVEIQLEPSTNDGNVRDPLVDGDPPSLLAGKAGVIRAVDGLAFEGRNLLLAHRSGVSTSVTPPSGSGFLKGLSATFRTGAQHALSRGAIIQSETALHITISYALPVSVSTQISALRTLLFGSARSYVGQDSEQAEQWMQVRKGQIPLVISVENADIISTLLSLKRDYEDFSGHQLKLTISGGSEAHLLAKEIASADVSVILTSSRPYPGTWESRRILPGPPLSRKSSITTLLDAGVNVAIGTVNESAARNTRFEIAWAALESNGTISKSQAIALASTNLHKALGVRHHKLSIPDLILYSGGSPFDLESKVTGVLSAERGIVETF